MNESRRNRRRREGSRCRRFIPIPSPLENPTLRRTAGRLTRELFFRHWLPRDCALQHIKLCFRENFCVTFRQIVG
jgi:hypothetical protein